MAPISLEQIRHIPFFSRELDANRVIPCLNFFVRGDWHCWVVTGDKLTKMKMWPLEAHYFGDRPERETDQRFPLLQMIAQRTFFAEIHRFFDGIWNDYQSLAASLAKLRLYFQHRDDGVEVRRFVQTELEYIILVCRSLYDLLQELVAALWDRTRIPDHKTKKKLPDSFGDVVRVGEGLRSAGEIQKKYGLLPQLAEWYAAHATFFLQLRTMRDWLVHGGVVPVELLFVTERGFAIDRKLKPFCDLYSWPPESELQNHLVSLRPVIARMVKSLFEACDSFARVLPEAIQLPSDVAPGLSFYSRGLHDVELCELDTVLAESLWWDSQLAPTPKKT